VSTNVPARISALGRSRQTVAATKSIKPHLGVLLVGGRSPRSCARFPSLGRWPEGEDPRQRESGVRR